MILSSIHDRMPAILKDDQTKPFLAGQLAVFHPLPASLSVHDAPNPLIRKPLRPAQDELF